MTDSKAPFGWLLRHDGSMYPDHDVEHAVLVHQFQIPRDFAKIGSHDDEEGIEVRHVALQFCLPALDAIDVGEYMIQVGAFAEAVVGSSCSAIDGHSDVGEGRADEPFGPFFSNQCAVGADAQNGASNELRHVVDQFVESGDGENLTALDSERGHVRIERHEFAPQFLSDLGRAQQVVPVLCLVAMDAFQVAGVSKDQAQAAGSRVEINVPLLVFQLAETEVAGVGWLCVGGHWLLVHRLLVPE